MDIADHDPYALLLQEKQMVAALQQAEIRYRSIFENATEGIFQITFAGHYLSANPALAKIYGYRSVDELLRCVEGIEHPLYVDADRRSEFMQLMQEQGRVEDFESMVYRQDGEVIWISENAHAMCDRDTHLAYYEGTVKDITARKMAELALQESEVRNQVLLNAIPDLMFRVLSDGTCCDVRLPVDFASLFSVSEADVDWLQEQLPLTIVQNAHYYLDLVLQTGEIQIFEYSWMFHNQAREYEIRLVRSGSREVLAIVRDITERKRAERLKNEFVSVVSHELRTPLTSIRGSLGLIRGGVVGELSSQAKELIDIAYKNSERLVVLINDILDIEKIESGKMNFEMKPMRLTALVEQAIEANQGYGQQYGITFTLASDLPEVRVQADTNRLMQVMANLLSNAAKFSPTGSVVAVAIVPEGREWVRVMVSDQGPGIPEEFRSRIFQKFAQVDSSSTRQQGGTGLGLSISKAIVERLGGYIGFKPHLQGGTTFYFDLPILNPGTSERSDPVATGQLPVLICEDNPDIAKLLSLILKQGGFQSEIAPTAGQAKALLMKKRYAAVTIDLVLPDQDGISLIRELREQESTRTIPVIVVSANAQQGRTELSGGSFAVVDCLEKPIDQDRLLESVQRAVTYCTAAKPRILHVEDDSDIVQIVSAILRDVAIVVPAVTVQEALQTLAAEPFDLVILDLHLPDGFGPKLLPYLNQNRETPLPVVVFSAQEVSLEMAHQVTASLVKSRTSNQELLETIKALIAEPQSASFGGGAV